MNRSTAPRIPLRMAALALAALAAVAGAALAQDAAAPSPAPPASVDTNGDGVLSAAEHSAAARGAFQRMDGDRDGRITVDEMGAMPGASAAGVPSAADRMKAVDTDGDGVLTAQEHAAATTAAYKRLDADSDGRLTLDEVRAGAAAAQAARQAQPTPTPR